MGRIDKTYNSIAPQVLVRAPRGSPIASLCSCSSRPAQSSLAFPGSELLRTRKHVDMEDSSGNFCYFHRDLSRGDYGSDVACLQHYLKQEGLMSDELSGYFGSRMEAAVIRWQRMNNVSPASGTYEFTSRALYAKRNKLPTAEELLALEVQAQGSVRTCLDALCKEPDGGEFCQTGCLKRGSSDAEKYHLCQQVCQVAAGRACDRAIPPTQSFKYKKCISSVARHCHQACQKGLKAGSSGNI